MGVPGSLASASLYHTHLPFSIFQVVLEFTCMGNSLPSTFTTFEMVATTVALVLLSVSLTSSMVKPLI